MALMQGAPWLSAGGLSSHLVDSLLLAPGDEQADEPWQLNLVYQPKKDGEGFLLIKCQARGVHAARRSTWAPWAGRLGAGVVLSPGCRLATWATSCRRRS